MTQTAHATKHAAVKPRPQEQQNSFHRSADHEGSGNVRDYAARSASDPCTPEQDEDAEHRDHGEPPARPCVPPSAECIRQGRNKPLLLRSDPKIASQQVSFGLLNSGGGAVARGSLSPLPLNSLEGFHVESELFSGRVCLLVAGHPSTPTHMFQGKQRRTWMILQGRFKRQVPCSQLMMGQEWSRRLPFARIPGMWAGFCHMARMISPCMLIGPAHAPSLHVPLVTRAQAIHVAQPGMEPSMLEVGEDMRLMGEAGLMDGDSGQPLPASERCRWFESRFRQGLGDLYFSPDLVYTIHCWQQYINPATCSLDLAFLGPAMKLSLSKHMAGNPLQFKIKDAESGEHVLGLELWHEDIAREAARLDR